MSKSRSINFPFVSLEVAISRVEQLYEVEGKNLANTKVAATHWGYSEASSGGLRTIAALRAFGLAEVSGSGDNRNVQISELALRILLDKREDSTERDNSIKIAAIKPKIFNEMWEKWGQSGLPSDATISHFLIFEKGLNEKSAPRATKVFRETVAFAKLLESEPISAPKEDKETERNDTEKQESPPPEPPLQKTGMRDYSFPLDEGQVTIQVPKELSVHSQEELKSWLGFIINNLGLSTGDKEASQISLTSGEQDT